MDLFTLSVRRRNCYLDAFRNVVEYNFWYIDMMVGTFNHKLRLHADYTTFDGDNPRYVSALGHIVHG